jgi:Zn-dependent protease/predicted transcriptional regulator
MLTRNLSKARFWTRLKFHFSWYLVTILIMAIVVTRFPEYYSFSERVFLGLCASLLFFLAVIGRQLAITVISHYRNIPLRGVVLYPFGGVHLVAKEDSKPILELLLALVGLLSSLLIVFIFYAVYVGLVIAGNDKLAWLIQWLAYINLMLFMVHIVPGLPLDGGRILRAILWKTSGNYDRANLISVRIGQGVAIIAFLGGITLLTNRQWFVGLLITFLGWILYIAATRNLENLTLTRSLKDISVQQIMSRDICLIPRHTTLNQLAKDYILATGQSHFIVFDEGKLHGFLTTQEMKSVPRKFWEVTQASQVMISSSPQTIAYIGQSAGDLLDRMNVYGLSYVPVLDQNQVVGILDRDQLIRFNKIRLELKI